MRSERRYQELASKWLDGSITDEEKEEFAQWYHAQNDEVDIPLTFARDEAELQSRILDKVNRNISDSRTKRVLFTPKMQMAVAASLALFFLFGGYFWYSKKINDNGAIHHVSQVQPGGNKATLTLADGQEIDLSEQHEGLIVGDNIAYVDGAKLFDQDTDESLSAILSTPKGGQYQIQLPDGSKVWLNSSSSLKFPKKFDERFREVELLSGEAFFEISTQYAHSKKVPFYVRNNQQLTEVLGTKFNVNMYEEGTVTTVTEGAVGVSALGKPSSHLAVLTVGKQAILKSGQVSVGEVNVEEFTAWKDGYFYFNDASIYTVMKEFERWYDIEIKYESTTSDYLFVGKIPRKVTLATALNVLKSAGVSYEWKDNRYLIIK
ncbi:FecR family protein [Sphingobacterium pedocola]|uniref:FecR family protein n=1 Tax=Sphingobacterium pedocola TaxID=2082722 RepID=A0ABR9T917_9SPHI|nr:FecR family protein [Sphingobacterium pedocola]MBE8721847.1 hypothetical protein [Sphingobacterium pedocola]